MVANELRRNRARLKALWIALLVSVGAPAGLASAHIQENEATRILKQMSDYIAGQKTIEAEFNSSIEVVTTGLEKIQFNSSGELLLQRPDKLKVSRAGGFSDVELTFDGKTATLYGKNLNTFAQAEVPGSTDHLLDRIRNEYGVQAPGTDLLLTDAYSALMDGAVQAKYLGTGIIGGVECNHLAFRNDETDWQLWVEDGANPIPRKFVITSKAVAGAPEYTVLIREWHTDEPTDPGSFTFTPPEGAKKLDFKQFTAQADVDEVPAGAATGEE